jgi:two-component system, cell cycle response regulator
MTSTQIHSQTQVPPMDENVATNLNDLIAAAEAAEASEAQRSLPIYLIVLAGGIPGAMIALTPSGTRVGRSSDNSIQLPDASVSRYHAVLRPGDDGRVRLTDLASTNGTFLNGRRISNHTPITLHDGDRLQFGSNVIVKFARPDPCEEQFQRAMFERTVRDGLTGLYNRSYFLDQVDLQAEQREVRGLGLAILMLDIDHFKRVNDTHGHDAGDTVLKEVASVIRQSTRSEDLVARYGGEEFVVALPIATPEQARERAERIRHNLAGRRIVVSGKSIHVTASLGMAFAPSGQRRRSAALLADADLGLYQAKEAGRNRVAYGQSTAPAMGELLTHDDELCGVLLTPLPEVTVTTDNEI